VRIWMSGRLGVGMNETRLRHLLAALALLSSLVGWSGQARAENVEALPGVAGLNTQGTWPIDLAFDWRRDRAFLTAELMKAGVLVAPLEAGPADVPRFLDGKLVELRCARYLEHTNCRMSIHWGVVDTISNATTYDTITRVNRYSVEHKTLQTVREALLRDSVASLTKHEHFLSALHPHTEATPPPATVAFKACGAPSLKMPAQAPDAIAGSVLIDLGTGIGSGFFLNDEGLVLTAAHVTTQPQFKVRLADGKVYTAGVVRINRNADVALVRVKGLTGTACLRLSDHEPNVGADLYAIGAPGDPNLSFSLTRGIVSSLRTVRGFRRIQTDTPISPGNSGGPLLDADGRVEAVVQAKVVRAGVEGVAFGLPSQLALAALGVTPGPKTDSELDDVLLVLPSSELLRDPTDPVRPLEEPEPLPVNRAGDSRFAPLGPTSPDALPPAADQRPKLPGHVKALRWGGLGLAAVGVTIAGISADAYSKDSSTQAGYERLRTWNDIGWIAAGVGATAFAVSFMLTPVTHSTQVSASLSPSLCGIRLEGEL